MPVIKSAKKRMRQNIKRRARNFPLRSELKTYVKKVLSMIKEGKEEEVKKILPKVYSIIDTACKKKIIHQNNAARKKSRVARALAGISGKGAPVKEAKVEAKAEKVEEKAEAKK
jgi:small subunit ribosomal protein S20